MNMFEEVKSMTVHFHEYGSVLLDFSSMTVWEEEEVNMLFAEVPVFTDSNAGVIQLSFDLLQKLVDSDMMEQLVDWLVRKRRGHVSD